MAEPGHRDYETFERYTDEEAAQWRGAALFNELPPYVLKKLDRLQTDYADPGERAMLLLALLLQKSLHEGHQWSAAIRAASVGTKDAHLTRPDFDVNIDVATVERHQDHVTNRLREIREYWLEIQRRANELDKFACNGTAGQY
jgi:hypothetical protein